MKSIILLFFILLIISCNNKVEFVESKVYPDMYLMKNRPNDSTSLKNEVILFIKEKYKKNINFNIDIYDYNSETKYFLKHQEDDGGPTSMYFLSNCEDDRIAYFSFSKCKNDSTKLVGEIRFDNKYGNYYKPDTIINECK